MANNESGSYYAPVSFYFEVEIDGADYSFKEASGLEVELEVEEIKQGGNNSFNHRVPGRVKYNNLILKRGMVTFGSSLQSWVQSTLFHNTSGTVKPKSIKVSLLDPKGKSPIKSWNFRNAYPVKWKVSDLNAEENAVAVETVEFAYESFNVS
jgi:phage tail-like protein